MAAETEGIALLSMYGDEEEDEGAIPATSEGDGVGEDADDMPKEDSIRNNRLLLPVIDKIPQILTSSSPLHPKDGADSKTLRSPLPQSNSSWKPSSPVILASPSPHPAPVLPFSVQEPAVGQRGSRVALTIVDYAHDEAAMSPEDEEVEIESGGYVLFGTKFQVSDGNSEETTQVTSQTLKLEYFQPSDAPKQSKAKPSMTMDCTETEQDVGEVETFQKFLPPPAALKCSEELQSFLDGFFGDGHLTFQVHRISKSPNVELTFDGGLDRSTEDLAHSSYRLYFLGFPPMLT